MFALAPNWRLFVDLRDSQVPLPMQGPELLRGERRVKQLPEPLHLVALLL